LPLADAPPESAEVVNLDYVINVVEDPAERAATLQQASDLARCLLVVSAQVLIRGRGKTPVEFGRGVRTGRGTFQKFYQQDELKSYLEEQLGTDALPAAPGVFYAFKDESLRQQFIANRFRRREILPRKRISERQFE
jgi:DNA phosphorothioation-associated putative methyltransferase